MFNGMPKENIFQIQALDFANQAIITRCTASIHVEDKADEVFWESVFNQFCKDKKFNFIYQSNSSVDNKNTTGVCHCLKYKDYLSKDFFICIDSDYRYLMKEPQINIQNHIFQTYTYSIENHYCFSDGLNDICKKCTGYENTVLDFNMFLTKYSNAIYNLLIWHLHLGKTDFSKFPKKEFFNIITLQPSAADFNSSNFQGFIDRLKQRCEEKLSTLTTLYPTADLDLEKVFFENLGLNADNAYLYIRGHNLYALVSNVVKRVNERILELQKQQFKEDHLKIKELYASTQPFEKMITGNLAFGTYPEIYKIEQDMKAYFEN